MNSNNIRNECIKKSLLSLAIVCLSACSNHKTITSYQIAEERIEVGKGQEVLLRMSWHDKDNKGLGDKFRVVKPSHTTSMTGLKVLSFLTGSHTTGFSKFDLVGDVVELEKIYTSYVFPKLKSLVQQQIKLDKETKFKHIDVYPLEFKLVYDELVGNSNYTLYYNLEAISTYTEKKDNGDIIAGDNRFKCNEKLGEKTFSEWEKDKYNLVLISVKQMADKCLSKMTDFLDKVK